MRWLDRGPYGDQPSSYGPRSFPRALVRLVRDYQPVRGGWLVSISTHTPSELIVHSPECQFPPFQLSTFRKINIINMIKTNGLRSCGWQLLPRWTPLFLLRGIPGRITAVPQAQLRSMRHVECSCHIFWSSFFFCLGLVKLTWNYRLVIFYCCLLPMVTS